MATIEVAGSEAQEVLETGLCAVLTLAVGAGRQTTEATGAAPIGAEGDDLARLFGGLIEDLLAQVAFYGAGLHDVTIDGVLQRERGGYRAWGYAIGRLDPPAGSAPPRLVGDPIALDDDTGQIRLRATFRRA
jgi:hypothetical protein